MESPLCPIANGSDLQLIETLAYHPGQGLVRRSRHLRRMERSAQALGMRWDRAAAEAQLTQITGDQPRRCRLTLDTQGRFTLTTAALTPTAGPWRIALAQTRLDSTDPWLRHKTTRRALYDQARATLPKGVDEMIFQNEQDALCEGTITNLFLTTRDGRRITPPLQAGVLPGILRETLIEDETYTEAPVTLSDLHSARALHMGNSLRGLIPALLVGPS